MVGLAAEEEEKGLLSGRGGDDRSRRQREGETTRDTMRDDGGQ